MRMKKPMPQIDGNPNLKSFSSTGENYSFVGDTVAPHQPFNTTRSRLVPQRNIPPNIYDGEREKFNRARAAQENKVDHRLERDIGHYNQVGDMFDDYRVNSTRVTPEMMPQQHPIHQMRGQKARRIHFPRRINLTSHGYQEPYDDAMFADRQGSDSWMYWD